jgi:hypothetical protein
VPLAAVPAEGRNGEVEPAAGEGTDKDAPRQSVQTPVWLKAVPSKE